MKNFLFLLLFIALNGCTPSFTGTIDNNSIVIIELSIYKSGKILIWSHQLAPGESINVREKSTEIDLIVETLQDGNSCQIDKENFQRGLKWSSDWYGKRFWSFNLKGCKGDGGVLIKQ